MKVLLGLAAVISLFVTTEADAAKPTIVLVHGAFADSSSWNGVIRILERDGYQVVAAANPLRDLHSDAAAIRDLVRSIDGPVVLVGHSYAGSVITEAADDVTKVKGLVYVAAFAPDVGESAKDLTSKFPGSSLGPTLAKPVPLKGGRSDLYIQQKLFPQQFAADVPRSLAILMAAGQRPITDVALSDVATAAAWRHIPSFFVYGQSDKNIPPVTLRFMAQRAKGRSITAIPGASHVLMVSHAPAVARVIESAAIDR
jgi:pimeloyl-ACP methyl ester carboxylesterase